MATGSEPKKRRPLLNRIFRWVLLPPLGLYVLLCIWFYLFREVKLLEPHKIPTGYVSKPKLEPSEDFFLRPPEAKINIQKFDAPTDSPKGTVFYLHGNRGNIHLCRWVIEPFLNAGYDVWTMDYRGFGKSTGRLSEAALLADAQMAYKRIREEHDEEDIIVWGRSFGSGIAAYVASINSPKTLVLETPYWSLPDAACHSRPYLLPFLFRYKLPTNEYLGYVDCPVHLIHGNKDEKIYSQSSKRLEKRCLELKMEVHFHQIEDGQHYLRSESKFNAVLEEILE
jgi:alpha-beta hydrolase superfamily lysophospholipase